MDGVRPRAVTLDEVARRSGVSRATASRALNGRARVNPEVRARVQMIADGMGYRPNIAARSLASGRVGVLGLVIPTGHLDRSPYEALLLEAVADAATGSGRGVMLWLAQSAPGPALRDSFRAGLVDGVVISEVALSASSWVEDLFDGPHPCVLVGNHPTRRDVVQVEVSNEAGASAAVDHLLDGGARRVAMIGGPGERTDSRDRRRGYDAALAARGMGFEPELVADGVFTIESGYAAMRRLLEQHPDALFAANDLMAAGALRAMDEAGLRAPDDIAVVGFDDLPIAATTSPPLSTIRQDLATVGAVAVDLLVRLLGRDPDAVPLRSLVETSLVVRGSTPGRRAQPLTAPTMMPPTM